MRGELILVAQPWFEDPADPMDALRSSLLRVVELWQRRGPTLRAIADAAGQDARLERIFRNVVALMDRMVATAIRWRSTSPIAAS